MACLIFTSKMASHFSLQPMNKPIQNYALIAALFSILGKMTYHLFFLAEEDFDMYSRFFYLLCFLAALFIGLRAWKIQHPGSLFTEDVKSGLKIASIYAMVISAFTYAYYSWINPAYFEGKIATATAAAEESGIPVEQLENVKNTTAFIFDAFTHSTLTLFGYISIGLFYTLILVLLFRYRPKAFGI